MTTANNTLALSLTQPSLIPINTRTGGLTALQGISESIFDFSDYVRDIFKALEINSRDSFWKNYPLISISLKRDMLTYFFTEGCKMGYCDFEDLKKMYLIQDEDKRTSHDAFTLTDLFSIACWYSDSGKENGNKALTRNHKQEIFYLANQVISVNTHDMYLFFQQWFYRDDTAYDVFSEEFYEYWYGKMKGTFSILTGKVGSLFMIAYQTKFPEKDIFSDLLEVNKKLILSDPTSHGIYRYFSLLYMIAEKDSGRISKISSLWCLLIETLIRKGSIFSAVFSLEMVLEDTGIPKEERAIICSKVIKSCKLFKQEIAEFLEKVSIKKESLA